MKVRINSDLTKSQRDKYASLKKELDRRVAGGEKDLMIKYRLGDPFLCSSKRGSNAKNV